MRTWHVTNDNNIHIIFSLYSDIFACIKILWYGDANKAGTSQFFQSLTVIVSNLPFPESLPTINPTPFIGLPPRTLDCSMFSF